MADRRRPICSTRISQSARLIWLQALRATVRRAFSHRCASTAKREAERLQVERKAPFISASSGKSLFQRRVRSKSRQPRWRGRLRLPASTSS